MTDAVDITARIAVVETRLSAHEQYCTQRAIDAARFETDMRLYLAGLSDRFGHVVASNNKFIRVVSGVIICGLLALVGGLIVYIWQTR